MIVATWRMARDGVQKGMITLARGGGIEEALCKAINDVEENELYNSVGRGGLPNINGDVLVDAAYMNGDSLNFGAIGAAKDLLNPVNVANELSQQNNIRNNFLVGKGAENYAKKKGYKFDKLITESNIQKYNKAISESVSNEAMEAYDGHDTVCMICKYSGSIHVATSTSGLFLKQEGRIGDSPIIGAGFYADSEVGAVSATGVGEDIMRSNLSKEIFDLIKRGIEVQQACEQVVEEKTALLKKRNGSCGSMSVIAMDKFGNIGIASNKEEFSFVIGKEPDDIRVFLYHKNSEKKIVEASSEWLSTYDSELSKGSGF